jgi:hypothetical protein
MCMDADFERDIADTDARSGFNGQICPFPSILNIAFVLWWIEPPTSDGSHPRLGITVVLRSLSKTERSAGRDWPL